MINKELVKRRFAAHFNTYNNHAKVQEDICNRLAIHLNSLDLSPSKSLEIGAGTGFLTKHLLSNYPNSSWLLNDISQQAHPYLLDISKEKGIEVDFLFEDAEDTNFGDDFDLIASASTIQWFDNIEQFIEHLPLKKGGYAALTTFAPGNFHEISYATQSKGLHYYAKDEYSAWFAKLGYKEILNESYSIKMVFESPVEVLRHLRYTGVNAIENVNWSKGKLEDFIKRYIDKFSVEDGVQLTYIPLLTIFQKG